MTTTTPSPEVKRAQRRRAIVASTVGTTIEWYDFFLYATTARRRWALLTVASPGLALNIVFHRWKVNPGLR